MVRNHHSIIPICVVALSLCGVAFASIRYKNCKSQFEVLDVAITGCGGQDRCAFQRGNDYTMQIAFKPNRPVESLKQAVWVHLGDAQGALTQFHLENDDVCGGTNNVTCPLQPGQTYFYSQTMTLLPEYPATDVQVNWLLTSPDGGNNERGLPASREVCVKFLAKVVD